MEKNRQNTALNYADAVKSKSSPQTVRQNASMDKSFFCGVSCSPCGMATSLDDVPHLIFSQEETYRLTKDMEFTLIGKFSHGYSSWHDLKISFESLKLSGPYSIKLIHFKHILISLSNEEDYTRLWSRGLWFFKRFPMRVMKWTPAFKPNVDSPFAPVWVQFPQLPVHLFDRDALFSIARLIGTPLRLDDPTAKLTRLSFARICVDINLMEKVHQKIFITVDDTLIEQKVVFENLPKYCRLCQHLGHSMDCCRSQVKVSSMDIPIDGQLTGEFGDLRSLLDKKKDNRNEKKAGPSISRGKSREHDITPAPPNDTLFQLPAAGPSGDLRTILDSKKQSKAADQAGCSSCPIPGAAATALIYKKTTDGCGYFPNSKDNSDDEDSCTEVGDHHTIPLPQQPAGSISLKDPSSHLNVESNINRVRAQNVKAKLAKGKEKVLSSNPIPHQSAAAAAAAGPSIPPSAGNFSSKNRPTAAANTGPNPDRGVNSEADTIFSDFGEPFMHDPPQGKALQLVHNLETSKQRLSKAQRRKLKKAGRRRVNFEGADSLKNSAVKNKKRWQSKGPDHADFLSNQDHFFDSTRASTGSTLNPKDSVQTKQLFSASSNLNKANSALVPAGSVHTCKQTKFQESAAIPHSQGLLKQPILNFLKSGGSEKNGLGQIGTNEAILSEADSEFLTDGEDVTILRELSPDVGPPHNQAPQTQLTAPRGHIGSRSRGASRRDPSSKSDSEIHGHRNKPALKAKRDGSLPKYPLQQKDQAGTFYNGVNIPGFLSQPDSGGDKQSSKRDLGTPEPNVGSSDSNPHMEPQSMDSGEEYSPEGTHNTESTSQESSHPSQANSDNPGTSISPHPPINPTDKSALGDSTPEGKVSETFKNNSDCKLLTASEHTKTSGVGQKSHNLKKSASKHSKNSRRSPVVTRRSSRSGKGNRSFF